MKHGYRPRTSTIKPLWYRRWESSQYDNNVFVVEGRTIMCRPEQYEAMKKMCGNSIGGAGLSGFGGFSVVVSNHLPPPNWMNRKARLRAKRQRELCKVRDAMKADTFKAELHGMIHAFDKRPSAYIRAN